MPKLPVTTAPNSLIVKMANPYIASPDAKPKRLSSTFKPKHLVPVADTPAKNGEAPSRQGELQIVLSFDVEEHYRIEAASSLNIDMGLKSHYRKRLSVSTTWLLELLAERGIKATFFVVGNIAKNNPLLVRAIHGAGHEVASHSWDHQRVHNFTPETFREDLQRSKDTLEQAIGDEVVGYRAPTFSIDHRTAWAIDVLVETGFLYDSSVFPVWHDRYGVPFAPRVPFLARGMTHSILELPPATLRLLRTNIPVGGGGYFRLLPSTLMRLAFWQLRHCRQIPVATLYFHPWEFDPDQARLPLPNLSGFRTYVGVNNNQVRLSNLLERNRFVCAKVIVEYLKSRADSLSTYAINGCN